MSEITHETWESTTPGKIVLQLKQPNGSYERFVVSGKKKFTIPSSDRERHQLDAIRDEFDFFTNGTFLPVADVIETAADADAATKSNPHHMSDDDMAKVLAGPKKGVEKALASMTAEPALQRFYSLSQNDEVEASKQKLIADSLRERGFPVAESFETGGSVDPDSDNE